MNRDTLLEGGGARPGRQSRPTVTLPDAGRQALPVAAGDRAGRVHPRRPLRRRAATPSPASRSAPRYVALGRPHPGRPGGPGQRRGRPRPAGRADDRAAGGGPHHSEVPAWDRARFDGGARRAAAALGATLPRLPRDVRPAGRGRPGAPPDRGPPWAGAATRTRRPCTSPSPRPATTAPPPTGSPSGTSPWTATGHWRRLQRPGLLRAQRHHAYSVNDITATPDDDGSITVHFGGDDDRPNLIPIMDGWNYTVRLYRPRPEVLDGSWTFPGIEPA